jgi:hypothetical protein
VWLPVWHAAAPGSHRQSVWNAVSVPTA